VPHTTIKAANLAEDGMTEHSSGHWSGRQREQSPCRRSPEDATWLPKRACLQAFSRSAVRQIAMRDVWGKRMRRWGPARRNPVADTLV
jgi:hypothetical protein